MKLIRYQIMQEVNTGTEEVPDIHRELHDVELGPMSDAVFAVNNAMAQNESHDGKITVEDIPDPETEPSQEEDTAAMLVDHEYRLTLLELGLTEA